MLVLFVIHLFHELHMLAIEVRLQSIPARTELDVGSFAHSREFS